MNNKRINKVISLVVAFIAAIGLFAGAVVAQAAEDNNTKKQPLHISMNYAKELGKGHTTPGALGQIDSAIENMWKNLPITVIDSQGKNFEVAKQLNNSCERTVGNFANGEKVTIKVDTSKLPDSYNLSWESDYTYPKPTRNYAEFQAVVDSSTPVRISLDQMKVKFDLKGGNIDGKSDSITNIVKKDNTVDFPKDPTKENVEFGGWYTELPDTDSYRQKKVVGKRYYWNSQSPFSDYSRDWMSWNDEKLDPLYDGIFLLRAQWNARYTFNANGGTFSDGTAKKSEAVQQGKNINILPAPTREDYQFLNWADAAGNTYNPGDTYTLNANTVFTANWKQISNTVTFMNGDNTHAAVKVETGKAIDTDALTDQSMPKNPTKDGYTFKEWNTSSDGKGTAFTGATLVNNDTTVYAIFTKNTGSDDGGDNDDNNGSGSVEPDSSDNPELNVEGGSVNNNRTLNGAANGSEDGAANGSANDLANGAANGVANRSGSAKSQATGMRSSGVLPNSGADASGVTFASFGALVLGLFVASGAVLNRKRAKYLR
ncbi:InlB B-repeat-containing protein [Gardnerella piotii]|uniref:InlB B-repeat-containing protein n=2 Tax=Gardnerella piotii TaxID=2792977 RepID=UPI003CE494CD